MELGLTGRRVLITGAGQGIGFAIAEAFLSEGASVALNDINEERAKAASSQLAGEVFPLPFDIADFGAVAAGVGEIVKRWGTIDILVNNAAFLAGHKSFLESDPKDWDREIKVCLYGTLNCSRAALPAMVSQRFGKIINIASDAGRIGQAREIAYAAAKGAIIAATKSLALEVGQFNVNVNAISPAATDTPLRQSLEQAAREKLGEEKYREREAKILKLYPLRRISRTQDIANAAVFLASGAAAQITGQVVSVNGGYSMVG